MSSLLFTSFTSTVYAHLTHTLCGTPETEEHWKHRHRKRCLSTSTSQGSPKKINSPTELPVFVHKMRSPCIFNDCPTEVPSFLLQTFPKVVAKPTECFCSDSDAAWKTLLHSNCGSNEGLTCVSYGNFELAENWFARRLRFFTPEIGGILGATPRFGWSRVIPLDKEMLVTDSGKLKILDCLLARLKQHGHRVLIYSQMTRMIDILEEYMWHRKHTYIRLDGSSKISDRRDMVADFQTR
ncbi:INO80 (predicted) [Pycnogonum litorale]